MSTSRSTVRSTPRPALRLLVGGLSLGTATVLLTACGAGQIGTIGGQVAAVNGAQGRAGQMAVRNVSLQFPTGGASYYSAGGKAPLLFTLANVGVTADQLVSVSTPAAASVTLKGPTAIPGGTSLVSAAVKAFAGLSPTIEAPKSTTNATRAPSSSAATTTDAPNPTGGAGLPGTVVGVVTAELTGLTQDVRPGLTIPVTFTFAKAGPVTLPVPVDAPNDAAPNSTAPTTTDAVPSIGY